MNANKLQEQVDIIEERILRVGGYLALLAAIGGTGLPDSARDLTEHANNLGEAMNALLEVKQELGLASNLTRVE